ncbi:MAG: VanZ family protein [Chloroflexi bacterium]|nr:VanZ family protein [Chloroflexota bacterium]
MHSPKRPCFHRRVLGSRPFIKYWLPVIAWMLLIFFGSTDLLSSERTSRIIGPVLRWLIPDVSAETIRQVQLLARKAAHLIEYAVLALLLWRARRQDRPRPWTGREAGFVLLLTVLYAVTDELHQGLVASRYASVADVFVDAAGSALGLLWLWGVGHWQKRW